MRLVKSPFASLFLVLAVLALPMPLAAAPDKALNAVKDQAITAAQDEAFTAVQSKLPAGAQEPARTAKDAIQKEINRKDTAALRDCKGKVNDMGGFGFRKLPCEGTCSPGVACDWQTETKPNGDKRSWCGCPNQSEPTNCHLAVLEPNQGAPSTECKGTCDGTKTCKEKKKPNPDGTNDISCECQ